MAHRFLRSRQRRLIGVWALALSSWLGAGCAAAGTVLAGAEASPESSYAYLGMVLPLAGGGEGAGRFVQRYWVDHLTYAYDGQPGEVEAEAWGGEAALGYTRALGRAWWAVYGGLTYRDTDLDPDDRSSEARGSHTRLRLQLEGEADLVAGLRLNANASYVFGLDAYWTRLRLFHPLTGHLRVGPELVFQGDDDYQANQVGVVLDGLRLEQANLAVKAGVSRLEGQSSTGYVGFELGYDW